MEGVAQTARNSGRGSTDCKEQWKGQLRLQGTVERAAQTAVNSGKGSTDCSEQAIRVAGTSAKAHICGSGKPVEVLQLCWKG